MKLGGLLLLLCSTTLIVSLKAQECLPDDDRVDCHPDSGANLERCLERGCTWCDPDVPEQNVPTCFFPKSWGYKMVGEPVNTGHGFRVELERITTTTLFGNDANQLTLEADFQSDYRLRIRISDDQPRWEVPLEINPPAANATIPFYDVLFINEPVFSFKVIRKSTGTILIDTSLGGFNFADQFIQIGYKIPSRNAYGLGEHEQSSLRHSFEKRPQFPIFTRDQFPENNANMYGHHPHLTILEEDGNAHAVVIVNSNAQEFEFHPSPGIVYKTIGGIFDMYVFLGPTPENTAQQYSEAVGRFPLPPFWALGFHLCRYGYNTIENLQTVVNRMLASEIPYDVSYLDIDVMRNNLDFTIDHDRFPGLNDYIKSLKTQGLKFMTILDPCISAVEPPGYTPYELGQEMDVWVKRSDGVTPAQGKVWPDGACYFPDYAKDSTKEWWSILIKDMHDNLFEFDAMWIDMNEPANFVPGDLEEGCPANNSLNKPPFWPKSLRGGGKLEDRTLCPDHVDSISTHYNTHSLYGWYESAATITAVSEAVGKRTFALSRSTFLGSGRWVAHWLGDNYSDFFNMYVSIIGMLQFNLFAMPFVGPDICGHQRDAPYEVCLRWHQLGAFYPFSRNHNAYGMKDQDPASYDEAFINSTRKALTVRYNLLPYLYTLLALHEEQGNTVARAMWAEFPMDITARGIDRQFLWGSGLLITPVLTENDTTVEAYFPNTRFFDYYTGQEFTVRGNYTTLDAPLDHINVHIHGGSIIPTQEPAVNTELQKNNPFGLIVALDDNNEATGTFYFDDGEAFNPIQTGLFFKAQMTTADKTINYTVIQNEYSGMATKVVNTMRLLGVSPPPTTITVDGVAHTDFEVLPSGEVFVRGLNRVANVNFVVQYN